MGYLRTVYSRTSHPKSKYVSVYVKEIIKRFEIKSLDRVLEIGCGNCDILNELKMHGLTVHGCDSDEEAGIEYPDLDVKNADIVSEGLPFEDESFDFVFSKSVIEHMKDPIKFMDEAFRVLKRGGKLITMTPDWESQIGKFYDDWTHERPFTIVSLENIYKYRRFKEIKVKYFYQLPITWKYKWLSFLFAIIGPIIPLRTKSKLRWVREKQLIAVGQK